MLENEQQVEMRGCSTPDKMAVPRARACASVTQLAPALLMDNLLSHYRCYRNRQARPSFLTNALSALCQCFATSLELFRELWRELIPGELRGHIDAPPTDEQGEEKERKCFTEFMQKRTRFFVIVLGEECSEEEMQEAFEKASFLTPEGRGMSIEQLKKDTSCGSWAIMDLSSIKRYAILFFRFDLFGHLLNFGNLTKQLVQAHQDQPHYFHAFRAELLAAYDHYEAVESEFVNCYMEKEDRLALDLE